ncbi:MAG TPA: hypothetical protein VIG90_15130 [Pedomonas sp.]|uniref:hypothetical protein n=1 Tax=Pedomonas sp. TaxID=2976421 RepID=UPI002F4223A9
MRKLLLNAWFLLVVSVAGVSAAQVPPPPPMPGQLNLADEIAQSLADKDVEKYSRLLTDDVKVYEDGRLVSSEKSEWIRLLSERLLTEGVFVEIKSGYYTTNHFLFIEYSNTVGSFGGQLPAECCWTYDAVSYDIQDGKIAAIRRLKGGPHLWHRSNKAPDRKP